MFKDEKGSKKKKSQREASWVTVDGPEWVVKRGNFSSAVQTGGSSWGDL